MNNRLRWLFGLLVSALALTVAVWGLHPEQILGALQGADFVFLLIATGVLVLTLVLRALRWRVLLGAGVSLQRSWSVLNIGYLANTLLPLRIGELARAYLISRDHAFGSAHALSSVALERILDALSVVLLLGVALRYVNAPDVFAQGGAVLALLGAGGLAAMLVAALWPAPIRSLGARVIARAFGHAPARAARWSQRLDGALDGLSSLREPRRLALALFWTAVIWLASIGTIYYGALAFVDEVPLATATFVLAAVGLGVAVPSSPGQVGVYELAAAYALEITGVARPTALAIALALHAVNLLPLVALGAFALVQEGESLQRLASETLAWIARTRPPAEPPAEPRAEPPAAPIAASDPGRHSDVERATVEPRP